MTALGSPMIDPTPPLLHFAPAGKAGDRLPDSVPPAISSPPDAAVRELSIAFEPDSSDTGNDPASVFTPEPGGPLARLMPVNLRQLADNVDAFFSQLAQLTGGFEMAPDSIALAPWVVITAAIALELALLPKRNVPDHQDLSDAIVLRLGEEG